MFRNYLPALMILAFGISACVTINVYFPAVAAQQAADRVIDEVWGNRAQPAPVAPPAAPPPEPRSHLSDPLQPDLPEMLGNFLLPVAVAQTDAETAADLQIQSPEIRRLTDAMEARFTLLRAHNESGAIGIGMDGYVVLRDPAQVPLAQRNQVRAWVANENADRASLYREIAQANGQPQWETQIRQVFAERWIARAPAGWFVQERNGSWRQK